MSYVNIPSRGVISVSNLMGALTLTAGTGISITSDSETITFDTSAITSINGDLAAAQTLTVGTSGTDFAIANNGLGNHVFNLPTASASIRGALSAADWTTFNNKLSPSFDNYITNSDAEVDTANWNLYNNQGNIAFAFVIAQDIKFTAVASGAAGNGINIDYIFHASQSYLTPLVTVLSPTHVTVAWYNGPAIANNPTATQLKAAWDAVPGAVALATAVITGTASRLQYETGSNITANGGDTTPTTGAGGILTGVTFTINTATPLVGVASFNLGKDAANRQGEGVSTDFIIDSLDKGNPLQISFAYQGSAGMILGSNSDIQVFIYDITNTTLIPVTPLRTLIGATNTPHTFVGVFQSVSTSVSYRLILHIATTNASAWDLLLDEIIVNGVITPGATVQVPSLVLPSQPISGAVTDHMVVMWRDGSTRWVPATIAGAAIPAFGDDKTQLGFATNIIGLVADIYIRGSMAGFSFGPFTGYEQYIDITAGSISPLPSPFNDTYVMAGMAISSTTLNIQFDTHVDLIANSSGTPLKGGILSNSAINDGTGDQVLTVGANGNALIANSAATLGINWAPAVVAGTGLTYTTATRSLTISNLAGDVTGPIGTTAIAAATVTGKLITGYVSGAGTVAATDTVLQAINKLNGNAVLLAPKASPVFTNDVSVSTGNLLISTLGKGPQVKTGVNAKIGTAILIAGIATVANTSVTANSRIFVTSNTDGGTPGFLRVSTKTAATSFVITSSNVADTSTVAWQIIESIP